MSTAVAAQLPLFQPPSSSGRYLDVYDGDESANPRKRNCSYQKLIFNSYYSDLIQKNHPSACLRKLRSHLKCTVPLSFNNFSLCVLFSYPFHLAAGIIAYLDESGDDLKVRSTCIWDRNVIISAAYLGSFILYFRQEPSIAVENVIFLCFYYVNMSLLICCISHFFHS